MKKKLAASITGALLMISTTVLAADVGVDLNISIGNRPRVYVPAPPPVVIVDSPQFIYPRPLGFHVAVGVPYDLFYIGASYYLFDGGVWYQGGHYNGPWTVVQHRRLPPVIREKEIHRIRVIRDEEYHVYKKSRHHYRGDVFAPSKGWEKHAKEVYHYKEGGRFKGFKEKKEKRRHGKHYRD